MLPKNRQKQIKLNKFKSKQVLQPPSHSWSWELHIAALTFLWRSLIGCSCSYKKSIVTLTLTVRWIKHHINWSKLILTVHLDQYQMKRLKVILTDLMFDPQRIKRKTNKKYHLKAPGALPHYLQCHTSCNPALPGFWTLWSTLLNRIFDLITHSKKKVDCAGRKTVWGLKK